MIFVTIFFLVTPLQSEINFREIPLKNEPNEFCCDVMTFKIKKELAAHQISLVIMIESKQPINERVRTSFAFPRVGISEEIPIDGIKFFLLSLPADEENSAELDGRILHFSAESTQKSLFVLRNGFLRAYRTKYSGH